MRNIESGSELIPVPSLRDNFRRRVDATLRVHHVALDAHAEYYLVNLLTLFARSEAFFEDRGDYYGLAPLAVMLRDAEDACSPDARTQCLQRLGDVALFVSGVLSESLDDALVDIDYYMNRGGSAYASLAGEIRGTARGAILGSVFAEFGDKFRVVVDVLQDVNGGDSELSDGDLLGLNRTFVRTGSERAREKLAAHDVVGMTLPGRTH